MHSKQHFIDQTWDLVGRKVSIANLSADIYETAKSSIGLPVAMDSPAITMSAWSSRRDEAPSAP
jgi:hypothetical protein